MSLLDILKGGKNTPEQIAKEMVLLERNIPTFKEIADKTAEEILSLRKRRLAGDLISDKDLKEKTSACESAKEDLRVAEATLEDLNYRLISSLEKERNHLQEKIILSKSEISNLKEEKKKELLALAIELHAKLELYFGSGAPEAWISKLPIPLSFDYSGFRKEVDIQKNKITIKEPTPHLLEIKICDMENRIKENSEELAQRLLNKFRSENNI